MEREPMTGFVSNPADGKLLMRGVLLKASAGETGGSFEVIELQGPLAIPPHVHRDREELFVILEGRFEFLLGEDLVQAKAGSVVFVPRGTPHAPRTGADGRTLAFVAPPGLEGFFEELGAGLAAGKEPQEIVQELQSKYDSKLVELPMTTTH
jgi:mannose-6-phosphate isomerase-like protein (cupin superfamily)